MADANAYTPPKIWTWEKPNGGKFAGINQPTAGSRQDKELPIGHHPLQLYSKIKNDSIDPSTNELKLLLKKV